MPLTRTSKLEAVNIMLSAIGEAPVNSLDPLDGELLPADVSIAVNVLDEVSKETQMLGWNFNREINVSINPTIDNEIILPANAASVDVEAVNSGGVPYVQRGERLYNKKDHTYTITSAVKCSIIYLLEWEDIPQAARHYIAIKSGRRLQDRTVGSELHHSFSATDEMQALVALKTSEAEAGDYSIFDNYDVYKTIDRGSVIHKVVN